LTNLCMAVPRAAARRRDVRGAERRDQEPAGLWLNERTVSV